MCGGPEKQQQRIPPGFPGGELDKPREGTTAVLLELAAADDYDGLKLAVDVGGVNPHEPDLWYGRAVGSRRMSVEPRTPLMIAALYGSVGALQFLLSLDGVEPKRACGSDGATALHCAAVGGASGSSQVVRLLLEAGADITCLDAAGNRPGDIIARSQDKPKTVPVAEKRDYPIVEQALPDMTNGVYSTDEFRMYTFKVKPCSRAYSHDWTECPFVHPGENARRRDPKKHHYSCVPCPEFRKGACRHGDGCEYAHGVFESWLHPAQYRTRLCKDETNCNRRVCFFAHKVEELRPLYASTGSAMPSPRSISALEMAALSSLGMVNKVPSSTPPMSPSSPMGSSGLVWPSQPFAPPALQLPGSRLKAALNARDLGLDMDLIDELAHLSLQPLRSGTAPASPAAASKFGRGVGSVAPSNLDELFSSINSGMNHNFGGNLPPSPARSSPFSPMSSRSAAFAKRSQSFVDRSNVNRFSSPPLAGISTSPTKRSMLTNWNSPTGKLDWGVQGEELQKLRKSVSFGRNTNIDPIEGHQSNANLGWRGSDQLSSSGALPEMLAPWGEQLYMEQEQMVA